MTEKEVKEKLLELGRKIEEHKAQAELHGIFSQDHEKTKKELVKRHAALKKQIDDEVLSIKEAGRHVSVLEEDFLHWMAAIDFDSKT